jgi:hypothetical protein
LPLWNQRISYHKDWIIQTGCQHSTDPPAEWNCDQGGFAPQPTPVPVASPTSPPVVSPTSAPISPPTNSPTRRPTVASTRRPTAAPTKRPTGRPQSPTTPVEPTIAPSREDGNGILPPSFDVVPTIPTSSPADTPSADSGLVGGDDDDDDDDGGDGSNGDDNVYVCPVCGEGYNITSPNSTVVVPILGEFLCADLVAAAQAGEFNEGQCGIIQVVSLPCLCEPSNVTSGGDEEGSEGGDGGNDGGEGGSDGEGGDGNNSPVLPPISLVADPQSPGCFGRSENDNALVPITISIQFDDSPEDIGWYIADEAYQCFRVGVPAMAYNKNMSSVDEVVYVIGGLRYMFVMEDTKGNGLCCGRIVGNGFDGNSTSQVSRPGSYSITSGDRMLFSGGGDFGYQAMTNFTAPER